MPKLSPAQRRVLEAAGVKRKNDEHLFCFGLSLDRGWFTSMFTTRGSIEIFSRPQTCDSLVRLGLFEVRQSVGGKEYRISDDGCNVLAAQS